MAHGGPGWGSQQWLLSKPKASAQPRRAHPANSRVLLLSLCRHPRLGWGGGGASPPFVAGHLPEAGGPAFSLGSLKTAENTPPIPSSMEASRGRAAAPDPCGPGQAGPPEALCLSFPACQMAEDGAGVRIWSWEPPSLPPSVLLFPVLQDMGRLNPILGGVPWPWPGLDRVCSLQPTTLRPLPPAGPS